MYRHKKEDWRTPELGFGAIKAEVRTLPNDLQAEAREIEGVLVAKIADGTYQERDVRRFFGAKLGSFRQPFSSMPGQYCNGLETQDSVPHELWLDTVSPIYTKTGVSEVCMYAMFTLVARDFQADHRRNVVH